MMRWKDEEDGDGIDDGSASGSASEEEEGMGMDYERDRSEGEDEREEEDDELGADEDGDGDGDGEDRGPLDRFADLGLASRGPSRRASPTPYSRRNPTSSSAGPSPPRGAPYPNPNANHMNSNVNSYGIPMSTQTSMQMGSYPHPHHYQPYPALTQHQQQQQMMLMSMSRSQAQQQTMFPPPSTSSSAAASAPVSRSSSSARLGGTGRGDKGATGSLSSSSRSTSRSSLPLTLPHHHHPHQQAATADLSALSLLASSELYEIERAEREREHLHLHPSGASGPHYSSSRDQHYLSDGTASGPTSRPSSSANTLPHPPPPPVIGSISGNGSNIAPPVPPSCHHDECQRSYRTALRVYQQSQQQHSRSQSHDLPLSRPGTANANERPNLGERNRSSDGVIGTSALGLDAVPSSTPAGASSAGTGQKGDEYVAFPGPPASAALGLSSRHPSTSSIGPIRQQAHGTNPGSPAGSTDSSELSRSPPSFSTTHHGHAQGHGHGHHPYARPSTGGATSSAKQSHPGTPRFWTPATSPILAPARMTPLTSKLTKMAESAVRDSVDVKNEEADENVDEGIVADDSGMDVDLRMCFVPLLT